MQTKRTGPIDKNRILAAWDALNRGDRVQSRRMSEQILREDPENPEAWVIYAKSLNNKEEEFRTLTKAQQEFPGNKNLKDAIYQELKSLLYHDPYLAYKGETDKTYQVYSREASVLTVPKSRAQPEPFPAIRPPHIEKAYRLLIWAALGLILSGVGALLLAPAAGLYALQELQRRPNRSDRQRAMTILSIAVIVFGLGLGLAYLLWLHLAGG